MKQDLGLQAALKLLAQCKRFECDLRQGDDPRIGIAKLMQAFAASPSIQETTCELSETLLEQLAIDVQNNTAPETPTELILRLCMGLYTETWSADNVTDDQVKKWTDKYHIHIANTFLDHKDCRPGSSCKSSCTTSGLLAYGLSCHDLEWFCRGVLATAVLKAYKQPGMVMSSNLTRKLVRHAQRLIALAPNNPASFEMLSYVQMKNTETLPDAAKYMLTAQSTAAANGDHVGVVRYGLQSLYFLLWMYSMKANSEDNRTELEHEVQPVLEHVQSAEAQSRLYARSDELHVNSETQNSWQSIARRHLHGARLKLKHLALSMSKEMPGVLMEYLGSSVPPLPGSLNQQVQASTSCLETQTDTSANSDTEPDDGSDIGDHAQIVRLRRMFTELRDAFN
ncbi:MAG: hypothetical protein FRX49_05963 [Trebouxia sp. A1-2]|nr:MAG: hypothetical protein FRX49_05963 [Trebouxia sp. A1-2]